MPSRRRAFSALPGGAAAVDPAGAAPAWTTVERPCRPSSCRCPNCGSGTTTPSSAATADGARKDVLSWGDAAGGGPYAMVEIYRPGAASDRFLDAPSEIAARIIDYTVTDDVKPAASSTANSAPCRWSISPSPARNSNGQERRCLGFARPFNEPAMQIAGWYCSAGEEVVDRATVGCMLDRLTTV